MNLLLLQVPLLLAVFFVTVGSSTEWFNAGKNFDRVMGDMNLKTVEMSQFLKVKGEFSPSTTMSYLSFVIDLEKPMEVLDGYSRVLGEASIQLHESYTKGESSGVLLFQLKAWDYEWNEWQKTIDHFKKLFVTGSRQARNKRSPMALIGGMRVLVGLYNAHKVQELRGQQEVLMEEVIDLQADMTLVKQRIEKTRRLIRSVRSDSEKSINRLTVYARIAALRAMVAQRLNELFRGLEAVLDRRITPTLIGQEVVRQAFMNLTSKAEESHHRLIFDMEDYIWQLPAEFELSERGVLTIVIGIPMRRFYEEAFRLYEVIDHPIMGKETPWWLKGKPDFIAVKGNEFMIMTRDQFERCSVMLGQVICGEMSFVVSRDARGSCVASMMTKDSEMEETDCVLDAFERAPKTIHVLNGTAALVLLTGDDEEAYVDCKGEPLKVSSFRGMRAVNVPRGCVLSTEKDAFLAADEVKAREKLVTVQFKASVRGLNEHHHVQIGMGVATLVGFLAVTGTFVAAFVWVKRNGLPGFMTRRIETLQDRCEGLGNRMNRVWEHLRDAME